MWYLITYEAISIQVDVEKTEVEQKFIGRDSNGPIIEIGGYENTYEVKEIDKGFEYDYSDFLNFTYKINPDECIVVNCSTVLIKHEGDIDLLLSSLSYYANPKSKLSFFSVSDCVFSGNLPFEFIAKKIVRNK